MPILAAVGFQSDRKSLSRSVSLSGFFSSHAHTVKTAQSIRFSSRVAARSRLVGSELPLQKLFVRPRRRCIPAFRVAMPKATVHEYDFPPRRKNQIRATGQ
jgi:hypothetical protein